MDSPEIFQSKKGNQISDKLDIQKSMSHPHPSELPKRMDN